MAYTGMTLDEKQAALKGTAPLTPAEQAWVKRGQALEAVIKSMPPEVLAKYAETQGKVMLGHERKRLKIIGALSPEAPEEVPPEALKIGLAALPTEIIPQEERVFLPPEVPPEVPAAGAGAGLLLILALFLLGK